MPCVLTILLIEGLDDYTVNDKGNIVFVQKTTEETDKLIAIGNNNIIEYNDEGSITNSFFILDKGILNNQKVSGETTYMSVKNDEQAKGLFEFLSENTSVEWGKVSFGKVSNYISTNNNPYDNGIETITYERLLKENKCNLLRFIDHSHPDGSFPSGFSNEKGFLPKGQGDKAFAEWFYNYYPKIAPLVKLRVYNPIQKNYIRYNNKTYF